MTEDEKYVREQWTDIHTRLSGLYAGSTLLSGNRVGWQEAAEFTRTRLQQIRDVEEEIGLLSGWKWIVTGNSAANRILAREQAALADLKRGLRVAEERTNR